MGVAAVDSRAGAEMCCFVAGTGVGIGAGTWDATGVRILGALVSGTGTLVAWSGSVGVTVG